MYAHQQYGPTQVVDHSHGHHHHPHQVNHPLPHYPRTAAAGNEQESSSHSSSHQEQQNQNQLNQINPHNYRDIQHHVQQQQQQHHHHHPALPWTSVQHGTPMSYIADKTSSLPPISRYSSNLLIYIPLTNTYNHMRIKSYIPLES